jgi:hypothetical protein
MFLKSFFVPHGEEFHDVNCEVEGGVNLCHVVVYKEGSMFRNVDPKKFEPVMNKGHQNFKHTKTWSKKVFHNFQKHHKFHSELSFVDLSKQKGCDFMCRHTYSFHASNYEAKISHFIFQLTFLACFV